MTRQLKFFLAVLLIIGIFFRFFNLDRKFYWYDETFTSLRISGYTQTEVVQQLTRGQVMGIEDLMHYQRPNPEKSLIDTVKGLAVEEPQLTPLYFVAARFWVLWFGHSVAAIRSLSALFSLLAFPAVYWLCLELFSSSRVGWFAVALLAVSPFHVLYAQEARPYSLWTVTLLLSIASLLRAIRLNTKRSWAIYAATAVLGLYTHLLSVLVLLGHALYVAVTERFRWTKTSAAFAIASGAAFLTFVPWIVAVIANFRAADRATQWSKSETHLLSLANNWAANISRLFFDFGITSESPKLYLLLAIPVILSLLILVGYAIYFLCRTAPQWASLFILISLGVTAIAIILPDLIVGGIRSTKSRYLIPCYLSIQVAVAYLLASRLSFKSLNSRRQQIWAAIAIAIFSCSVLSCAISSQAQTWWTKESGSFNLSIARIVNQATRPLTISHFSSYGLNQALPLSYLLEPKTRFLFIFKDKIPAIPTEFDWVFISNPPDELFKYFKNKGTYKIEVVNTQSGDEVLYKLVKK